MKKHYFFDMDGTITPSRSAISRPMQDALMALIDAGGDVVIVSGATQEQIQKQISDIVFEHAGIMSQNGNLALSPIGDLMWKHELNDEQRAAVVHVIEMMIDRAGVAIRDPKDITEDRGCQISYSLIGHNADLELKKAIDPDHKIRERLMDECRGYLVKLNGLGITARIGGTTCIDFIIKDKGQNVEAYLAARNWQRNQSIYIGDALFPGGNDESVVGIVPTLAVRNPAECLELIREFEKKI